jgi:hypothetical protein
MASQEDIGEKRTRRRADRTNEGLLGFASAVLGVPESQADAPMPRQASEPKLRGYEEFDPDQHLKLTKFALASLFTNGENIYFKHIRPLLRSLDIQDQAGVLRIGDQEFDVRLCYKDKRLVHTIQIEDSGRFEAALRNSGILLEKEERYSSAVSKPYEPDQLRKLIDELGAQDVQACEFPGTPTRGITHEISVMGYTLHLSTKWRNEGWIWTYERSSTFFQDLQAIVAKRERDAAEKNRVPTLNEYDGYIVGQRAIREATKSDVVASLLTDLSKRIVAGSIITPLPVPPDIRGRIGEQVCVNLVKHMGEQRIAYPLEDMTVLGDPRFLRQFFPTALLPISCYSFNQAKAITLGLVKERVDFPKRFYPAVHALLGDPPSDNTYAEKIVDASPRPIRVFTASAGGQSRWCAAEEDIKILCSRANQRQLKIPTAIKMLEEYMVRFSGSALREALHLSASPEGHTLSIVTPQEGETKVVGRPGFPIFWTKDAVSGMLSATVWKHHLERVRKFLAEKSPEMQRQESLKLDLEQRKRELPSHFVGKRQLGEQFRADDFVSLADKDNSTATSLFNLAPRFFRSLVKETEGLPVDMVFRLRVPGTGIYFTGVPLKASQQFAVAKSDLDRLYTELASVVPGSPEFKVKEPVTLTETALPSALFKKRQFLQKLARVASAVSEGGPVATFVFEDERVLRIYRREDGRGTTHFVASEHLELLARSEMAKILGARYLQPFDGAIHLECSGLTFESGPIIWGSRKWSKIQPLLEEGEGESHSTDERVIHGIPFFKTISESGKIRWTIRKGDVGRVNSDEFEREIFAGEVRRLIDEEYTFLNRFALRFSNGDVVVEQVLNTLPQIDGVVEQKELVNVGDEVVPIEVMQNNGNYRWAVHNQYLDLLARHFKLQTKVSEPVETKDSGAERRTRSVDDDTNKGLMDFARSVLGDHL